MIDGPTGRTITYAQLRGMTVALAAGLASRGFGRETCSRSSRPTSPSTRSRSTAWHGRRREHHGQLARHGRRHRAAVAGKRARGSCSPCRRSWTERCRLPRQRAWTRSSCSARRRRGVRVRVVVRARRRSSRRSRSTGPRRRRDADVLGGRPASQGRDAHATEPGRERAAVRRRDRHPPRRRVIGVLPFFHIYGMTVLVNLALRKGRDRRDDAALRPGQFLGLMEKHRVTFACLVPPIVLALAKHPAVDKHDLSRWSGCCPARRRSTRAVRGGRRASGLQCPPGLRPDRDLAGDERTDARSVAGPSRRRAASSCRTPRSASRTWRPARTARRTRTARSGCADRR